MNTDSMLVIVTKSSGLDWWYDYEVGKKIIVSAEPNFRATMDSQRALQDQQVKAYMVRTGNGDIDIIWIADCHFKLAPKKMTVAADWEETIDSRIEWDFENVKGPNY